MTPKSIWYLSKYVAPPGGGKVGSRGFMLMRELTRMGHTCTIITSDSNALIHSPGLTSSHQILDMEGLTFCWVRTLKYSTAKSIRRILSWLDFELRVLRLPLSGFARPDAVIVSCLSLLTIFNGLRLRQRFGCRLIFEVRDIWPLTLTEEGGFSPRNPLVMALGWVERLAYRRADAIVGTMPNLSEHVAEVLGSPRQVHCIPMGIDPDRIDDVEQLPDEYIRTYLPEGKFTVAHVGSIGITNALGTFLECAARMSAASDIQFLLVGSGDLRNPYIEKYGHLCNLTFAPAIPQKQVRAVLQHCDLLYFSSFPSKVWRYGQSLNKVIDYMLSGKPIVASYSGYPSMINEAGCGVFVPAGDLQSLVEQVLRFAAMPPSEREGMGAKGRGWIIANRSYHSLAKEYLNLIFPAHPEKNPDQERSGIASIVGPEKPIQPDQADMDIGLGPA